MGYKALNVISNYIYLILGIYLLTQKYYVFGIGFILMWYASHKHHEDIKNTFWTNVDSYMALFGVAIVLYTCFHKLNCVKNLLYLVLVLCFFLIASMNSRKNNIDMYNLWHSIWHIVSGLFLTYIILI